MSTHDDWRAALAARLGEDVRFDLPLASRVAFKIGGTADAFATPRTAEMLADALRIARAHDVSVTILGTGSNVLVSDLGIRGLTIRLKGELADIHVGPLDPEAKTRELEVGAGALNAQIVALALSLGLVGIEFLGTIPGTFGGALVMNAGAHGGEIAPYIREVRLIDRTLTLSARPGERCGFGYRSSGFLAGEIITGASIVVPAGDGTAARAHLEALRARRKSTQPLEHPNAGSIFKNPTGDHAGRLIEAAGLKGRRRGGAEISPTHANFIVNLGGATALDVFELAEEARTVVRALFGVELEWEVKRIGDWSL